MQVQHSRVPGAQPNILPGERAVNLADGIVFLRSRGKMLSLVLEGLEDRLAPPPGPTGAPLVRVGSDGLDYATQYAPTGYLAGAAHVDTPPPDNSHAIPGMTLTTDAVAPEAMTIGTIRIEPFYVASEGFELRRIAFSLVTPSNAVKFGVAQADGTILTTQNKSSSPAGLCAADVTLPLPKGWYLAFLWTESNITIRTRRATRINQGLDFAADGTPQFIARRWGEPGGYEFLDLPPIIVASQDLSPVPGEPRACVFQWVLK